LTLFDMPLDDVQWRALEPPLRRRRILDACKRVLLGASQVQPVLAVFEDLHWIDSETRAFLNSLLESPLSGRLLVLVNFRPEFRHRWESRSNYTQLRIDPLGSASAEELLNALLGGDASLDRLKKLLIAKTDGNPLFLEECVRALIETKAVVGDRGAFRVMKPIEAIKMPATVQVILAARIDRLPPEVKQLLQLASVIGHAVPFRLLEALAEERDKKSS
jgi:predicted ATPase